MPHLIEGPNAGCEKVEELDIVKKCCRWNRIRNSVTIAEFNLSWVGCGVVGGGTRSVISVQFRLEAVSLLPILPDVITIYMRYLFLI